MVPGIHILHILVAASAWAAGAGVTVPILDWEDRPTGWVMTAPSLRFAQYLHQDRSNRRQPLSPPLDWARDVPGFSPRKGCDYYADLVSSRKDQWPNLALLDETDLASQYRYASRKLIKHRGFPAGLATVVPRENPSRWKHVLTREFEVDTGRYNLKLSVAAGPDRCKADLDSIFEALSRSLAPAPTPGKK